jgi:hypothetical protein
MEDVEFRIEIHSPVALTLDAARDVAARTRPTWRLTRISLRRLDANVFECKIGIDVRDISKEDHADLIRFRDTFLSLLALIAMVPVRPQIKGTFTFPLGGNQFAQISLGPMNYTFPESPMFSFGPLVEGFAFDDVYRAAVWFIWQAINSASAVHRFLNLAIAYELVVGIDSPVQGSKAPRCSSCGKDINPCPHCQNEIKIPPTLRERGEFLFVDRGLLSSFIEYRNRIFHGRLSDCIADKSGSLTSLNAKLLVNIRNYFGQKLGLRDITLSEIGQAVNVPEIFATVFYELKDENPSGVQS